MNAWRDGDRPAMCEIRVRGGLPADWSTWFEGLALSRDENGDTVLRGQVRDQAALYGLLDRLRDLGLTLLSMNLVRGGET